METALPVTDRRKQLTAEMMNLLLWQAAGIGRTGPKATILFDPTSTGTIVWQELAWDPNRKLAKIAFSKVSTGIYQFSFAASYPDQRGVATPYTPRICLPQIQGTSVGAQVFSDVVGQDVNILVLDDGGSPIDRTILLVVW
jgi:hypothetical protein